jgi:selenocysteine-specific elongation factor
MARLALLEQSYLGPGQRQFAQFRLEHPLGIVAGDRFVVRANDPNRKEGGLITVGGGRVADTSNVRLRRRRPWTLAALEAQSKALDDPIALCATLLRQARRPLSPPELARLCQLHAPDTQRILEQLRQQQMVRETSSHTWTHNENVTATAAQVLEALGQFHRAKPKQAGLEIAALAVLLSAPVDRAILDLAIQDLVTTRKIRLEGGILSLASWQAQVSSDEESLCTDIATAFQEARWAPPSLAELATRLNQPSPRIAALIQLLLERAILVRVNSELWFHRDAVEAARRVVLQLFAQKTRFTTMDFRDALGVSRKYAVPLLDSLDASRFTVRSGNQRTPGVEARKRLSASGAQG